MRHLPILTLSLALFIALTACAGSDGADGSIGPQGEPGQAAQVEDLDAIAQMLDQDPAFRAALAQVLVEQYPDDVKGPMGDCDAAMSKGSRAQGACLKAQDTRNPMSRPWS